MKSSEHAHRDQHLAACKSPVQNQEKAMTVSFFVPFIAQAPHHEVALCPLL